MSEANQAHGPSDADRLARLWWIAMAAVATMGLVVRLGLIAGIDDAALSGPDGPSYDAAARALIDGQSPWDVWELRVFPVGYAAALAAMYAIAGVGAIWSLLLIQSLALLGACVYLSYTSLRVLGRKGSLLLFIGLVLSPASVESSTSLMYEGILLPVSCLILGASVSLIGDRPGQWPIGFAATAAFVGVLVHPRYAIVVLAVCVGALVAWRRGWVLAAALTLATIVAASSIAAWNSYHLGALSLSSNQGSNLVIGLDPEGRSECAAQVYEPTDWVLTTPAGDAQLASCALDRIRTEPDAWLALAPAKVADHLQPASIRALQSSPLSRLPGGALLIGWTSWALVILTMCAALLGVWTMSRRAELRFLVVACASAVLAPMCLSVVFFGLGRFSYASLPFLYLLASAGMVTAWDEWPRHRLAAVQAPKE